MIILKNQIHQWWAANFPNEPLLSIKKPSGGAMTQSFILNENFILKVYVSKDGIESREGFFDNAKRAVGLLGIFEKHTPSVKGIFENDEILGASGILVEYIESTDLSNVLYKISPEKVFEHGCKVGKMIKKMHEITTVKKQEYNTQKLLDLAKKALEFATKNKLLNGENLNLINGFLSKYKPRVIQIDFVLVHQDLHPENYLIDSVGNYFLIDFDMSFVGWKIFELRKLIYAALIPAYLVPEILESFYPNKSMLDFCNGLKTVYPELFDPQYIDEIKLLNLPQILYNLKKLKGLAKYNLTMDIFEMIYRGNILDELFAVN
jgi:aminoglycoside phosphotransferase (APT) family kinase protein